MSNESGSTTQAERIAIIKSCPLFCLLTPADTHELALLLKEVHANKGTIITKENDIVDSFYFIASGSLDVTRVISFVENTQVIHIATLGKDDTIGFANDDIFARGGLRTATVTATLPSFLLKLDLNDFNSFLQRSSVNYPGLQAICERIYLMSFIKQIHLFKDLDNDKIRHLVTRVKKNKISAGTVIFKQGDVADKFYGVISGKVAIVTTVDGREQKIKTLESPNVIGEVEFFNKGLRNVTAYAETDGECWVLEQDSLESNEKVDHLLNILRIQRIKPVPVQGVNVITEKTSAGNDVMILYDTIKNSKITITPTEYAMWNKMNGELTLHDLLKHHHEHFDNVSLNDLYAYVLMLEEKGFVTLLNNTSEIISKRKKWLLNIFNKIFKREKRDTK